MKITKRKRKKILGIIKNIRINKDLLKFGLNIIKRTTWRNIGQQEMPYPTTLMLELSNKCNLRCTMCPRVHPYGKDMSLGEMDISLAYKIIDECYPYLQSIGLTGMGETLFANKLLEVASYIKKKKRSIIIFISTNANIPDFMKRITPVLPLLDTVQVSIDGISDVYDSIRLGGNFQLFEENIKKLVPEAKRNNVDVMFNMVVSHENYKEMSNVIDFAGKNNIHFVNFSFINLASIPGLPITYYDFFKSTEYKNCLKEALQTREKYEDMEVTGLGQFNFNGSSICPLVKNHFQINIDGSVPPCCAKPFPKELNFGNVREKSVISVLNSETARQFRRSWMIGNPHSYCYKCNASLRSET